MSQTATPMRQARAVTSDHPAEDLDFQSSPEPSVGVELELQILDRESGDLAPGAVRLLQTCAEEKVEGVTAELLQSTIEIKTGICRNVNEVRESLVPTLRRVANLARSLGYDLAFGGTHPFNRTSTSTVFPTKRYQRIQKEMPWLVQQGGVFGL